MEEIEEWKEIPSYIGYEASTLGRIRNKKTGKVLKPDNSSGYSRVILNKKNGSIHRLVAEAFLPNLENKRTVNHINGIKLDNRLCNLEWATYKEQSKHSKENNLRGKKTSYNIKLKQYNLDGSLIKEHLSFQDAAEYLGIKNSIKNISACIRRGTNKACGYIWEEIIPPDLENEIWKPLIGIMDENFISNYGRVKNRFGKLLKISDDNNGYKIITIKHKGYKLHRLVAIYFIENINNKPFVNHINGIKYDNRVENLEWVTLQENVIHSIEANLRKTKRVIHYNESGKILNIYKSRADAGNKLNVSKTSINEMCNKRCNYVGKDRLFFKFLDIDDDLVNMVVSPKTKFGFKPFIIDIYSLDKEYIESIEFFEVIIKKYKTTTKAIKKQCEGGKCGIQCKNIFRYHGDPL